MGTLLLSCVEMREPIELLLGELSGVGLGIHVIDGGSRASMGRGGFWGRLPPLAQWFQWHFCNRNVFDSCMKS